MKIIQSDYIHKNEAPTDSCDECHDRFDLSDQEQVFVVQTEDDELFAFCDSHTCYDDYIK